MAVTGNLQIKNGKYHVVLNLRDENGKRRQKWISTELPMRGNKKAAERFLQEKLIELNGMVVPQNDITVAEYFELWLVKIKKEVRQNTYRNYEGNMQNHIIPYFKAKNIPLQALTTQDLEAYFKAKLKRGSKLKTGEALSPTTVKHHQQNISKALSDAVHDHLIPLNPATAVDMPKPETKVRKFKPEFLNTKEIDELLVLFNGSVVELPVRLTAFYGFRRSEVLGLKWDAIDFQRRTITVENTLQQGVGGDYEDETKTDSSMRTLPMPDSIYELIKHQGDLQDERKRIMGDYYIESDFLCTWPDGRVITPNYLTKTFHKTITKSTLPQVRLHDLRHSAATNLLEMGFNVSQVAEWLGHESPNTTLKFYGHAVKTSKVEMAAALDDVFEKC